MELYKLTRRPVVYVLFLVLLAGFKGVALLAGGGGELAAREGSAYAYLANSASITMKIWWFLLLCLAAASLSGERSRGILRMHLSRPVKRESFYLSRLAAFLLAALCLLCADAFMGVVFASIFRTFGDVADPALQGPQFAGSAMALSVVRCYALTFLGIAATISLGYLFSVLCAHPTTAIAWAAGSGLVIEGVRLTLGDPLSAYMVTGYNSLHFDQLRLLAQGTAQYTPPGFYTIAIAVPLAYCGVLNLVSLLILKRSDITE
jgi:ABC-type transport system involved in multi-copper enzyme maturation permease subunit